MRLFARRIAFYLLTAWVALTVNFFLPRLVPGNPVATAIAGASRAGLCNRECVHAIELQFGLHTNTPILLQYLQYWGNLLQGNLGQSWFRGTSRSARCWPSTSHGPSACSAWPRSWPSSSAPGSESRWAGFAAPRWTG